MDLQLTNKKALVMGSSTGIGKAIAEALLKEGCVVTLCARQEERLRKTAQDMGAQHCVAGDLSLANEATRITQQAAQLMGGLDILVTNTGGPAKGQFMDISLQQWHTDFQNLWLSLVESVQVALPIMKKNNYGRILMITSIAGNEPLPGLTTSNGLRAGLEGLSKSIAHEMAAFGITSNILRPGYTNTDRLKELKLSEEKIKQMVPAGRLGDPEELASLATFLASPRAAYITGQAISIDGGVQRGY